MLADRTRVMFDCGIHLGYQDENLYPLLSKVAMREIACVFVSHFHLDHCGSLVYLTQVCKFTGPIYMTHPTKAIVPEMLMDMQRFEFTARSIWSYYLYSLLL